MKNYVSPGELVPIVAPATVAAGRPVQVATVFLGIAQEAADNGAEMVVARKGMFDLAKATGASTSVALGALVYSSGSNAVVSTSATSNALVGICMRAASNTDTTVRVALAE